MIYTCSYKNFHSDILKGVSISGDKGKGMYWYGSYYTKLAPKKEFWEIWHNNIGKVDNLINNKYYIEEYYKQVLSNLDPLTVYRELDYTTLLCYEDNNEFCHRYIVSAWIEIYLNFKVYEVKVKGLNVEKVDCPIYNFVKETLEEIIKKNIDMKEFNSIRELYLYNKSNTSMNASHNEFPILKLINRKK